MSAFHPSAAQPRTGARYRLIAFIRVEPEDDEHMTYEDALAEKRHQELMSPENLYRIEEVC